MLLKSSKVNIADEAATLILISWINKRKKHVHINSAINEKYFDVLEAVNRRPYLSSFLHLISVSRLDRLKLWSNLIVGKQPENINNNHHLL